MLKHLPILLIIFSITTNAQADMWWDKLSIFYEHNAAIPQRSYESGGLEFSTNSAQYGATADFYAGFILTRIDNLTMYPGETDYHEGYLYYGLTGNGKLRPYINTGMDVGHLIDYFLSTSLFGCESGCMPHGSRFLTVGLNYSGSFYEIGIYRRFYALQSDTNFAQFAVTGLRYSIKF